MKKLVNYGAAAALTLASFVAPATPTYAAETCAVEEGTSDYTYVLTGCTDGATMTLFDGTTTTQKDYAADGGDLTGGAGTIDLSSMIEVLDNGTYKLTWMDGSAFKDVYTETITLSNTIE